MSRTTSLFIVSTSRCFNKFIAFNFSVSHYWEFCFFVARFWDRKSWIKYSASRAFFPACFLPCTSCLRGRHSHCLACLLSYVFPGYFNFDSKQSISKTLFGRRPNKKQATGENSYDDIKFFFQVKANYCFFLFVFSQVHCPLISSLFRLACSKCTSSWQVLWTSTCTLTKLSSTSTSPLNIAGHLINY